ncbi:MAG: hypothetical protein WCW27_06845 [Patescibacteria group bacterium]|jgi:hypothetical protein
MFEQVSPKPVVVASNPKVSPTPAIKKPKVKSDIVNLLERAKLSGIQKLALILITIVVIVLVLGIGVWLNSGNNTLSTIIPVSNNNNSVKQINNNSTSNDSDNDGLTDYEEINIYHTNPNNRDTDGDGYVDGYEEVDRGFNPTGAGKLTNTQ